MHSGVEVIYIGGYGRSGSTLLDLLLARRSGSFSAGEMWRLFDEADSGGVCGCGAELTRCELWGPVLRDVSQELQLPYQRLHAASEAAEFARHGEHGDWDRIWGCIFRSLLKRHPSARLIDSSKTSGGMRRAGLLLTCPNVKVVGFVHLVRALPAVVFSLRRGSNRTLEKDPAARPSHAAAIRGIAGWVRANANATWLSRHSSTPRIALTYDDLTADAVATSNEVLRAVGWPNAEKSQLGSSHTIGGNRFARAEWDGTVRRDDEWQTSLPTAWRLLSTGIQRLSSLVRII